MDIRISIIVDKRSDCNCDAIVYVSTLLEEHMAPIDYGVINHFWIVCQATNALPGFDKPIRPIFREHRHCMNLDKTYTDYYGVYSNGFNIDHDDYEQFVSASKIEARKIVARKVVESLSTLDRLSKKASGFDKERFKSDVIKLFKENELI